MNNKNDKNIEVPKDLFLRMRALLGEHMFISYEESDGYWEEDNDDEVIALRNEIDAFLKQKGISL